MRFKKLKGVTDDMRNVIMYDLEMLELKNTKENKYHYNLLRGNLIDLLGVRVEE
jgi:hypothetical protein